MQQTPLHGAPIDRAAVVVRIGEALPSRRLRSEVEVGKHADRDTTTHARTQRLEQRTPFHLLLLLEKGARVSREQ